jgi:Methyltransferase domain
MKNFLRRVHNTIFPSYIEELKKASSTCESLLDVGCGVDSPVQYLPQSMYRVGVDVFAPAIETSKKRGIHNEYAEINVGDIDTKFAPESFDCVLASDLIEHITKEEGLSLMKKMERIAKHKVIIFTPRGFVSQDEYEGNPWQVHRSGWEVEEMRNYGYEVIGISGLKSVWNMTFLWKKRDDANILIRIIRKILVDVTQLYARSHPESAYQIMCIKTKSQTNS